MVGGNHHKKLKIQCANICSMKIKHLRVGLTPFCCCLQMERHMSMGSNMMGMQSPAHSSSCSSTHIPTMHSEAKLVSKIQVLTWKHTDFCTHTKYTRAHVQVLQLFFSFFFPLGCASKAVLLGLCGFHHLVCNQSCV